MRRKGGCHRRRLWKSAERNPEGFAFVTSHPFANTAKGWATRQVGERPQIRYCTMRVKPVVDTVDPLVALTTTL